MENRIPSAMTLTRTLILSLVLMLTALLVRPVTAHEVDNDSVLNAVSGHNRAALLLNQVRMGNNEALLELQRLAYDGVTAYVILLAYHEASQGDYKERDRLIWKQLKQANKLESLIILNYFAYIFDNEALAAVVRDNLDEDGTLNHHALQAIRDLSFTPEQLQLMSQCHTRLTQQFPENMLREWPVAQKVSMNKTGACFQGPLVKGQLNATR